MTHPLTDEIIEEITEEVLCYDYSITVEDALRIAADWQLEQVVQAWEQCMEEPVTDIQVIRRFEQKLKAMRPQQQEDN